MPNPLSSLKKALLGAGDVESVNINGRNVEFQRMPHTGGDEVAGALTQSQAHHRLLEAQGAEDTNRGLFDRMEEVFDLGGDPTAPQDPEIQDNLAIDWYDDPGRGIVGKTSVARLDEEAYGLANAPEIRRELERRAKGGRMFDQAMPQNYPDASDPMHHYDRDLMIVGEQHPLEPLLKPGSPGQYNSSTQRITLDYDDAGPEVLRHEQGHAAAEAVGGNFNEDKSNWLSWGSGDKVHPFQLKGTDARYLTSFPEMKPYMRDLKYQNYYGLADGSVEPNMKRPDFAALTDQLNAEGGDFHRLMEETKLGEATPEDFGNMTLPALREAMVKTYMNLGEEGQRRMRLLYALLSGMPLSMAMEEDDGSN